MTAVSVNAALAVEHPELEVLVLDAGSRAHSGWALVLPLTSPARAWTARLPAEQLHALADLRRAGQRGRRGQLRRRLLRPLVRAGVRRHAWALEDDAQVMSNTQLEKQLAGQPAEIRTEIVTINNRRAAARP